MKKFALLILIVLLLVSLACCKTDVFWYAPATVPNNSPRYFTVYLCGAVAEEGYYLVEEGSTVGDALAMAGVLPEAFFSQPLEEIITQNRQIVTGYYYDGGYFACVNLNGLLLLGGGQIANVDEAVVRKIRAHLAEFGKITDKQILKSILTAEEYQQNYYKFYVSEADYEKIG